MEHFLEQATIDLLRRFIRASGSLRELAESFGEGTGLDGAIDRLGSPEGGAAWERALVSKYLSGSIDRRTLKELVNARLSAAPSAPGSPDATR